MSGTSNTNDVYEFRCGGYEVRFNPDTRCVDILYPDGEKESFTLDEIVGDPTHPLAHSTAFVRIVGQWISAAMGLSSDHLDKSAGLLHMMEMVNAQMAAAEGVELPDIEQQDSKGNPRTKPKQTKGDMN